MVGQGFPGSPGGAVMAAEREPRTGYHTEDCMQDNWLRLARTARLLLPGGKRTR